MLSEEWSVHASKMHALGLMQDLFIKLGYGRLTYVLAVHILRDLEFEGMEELCYRTAGTVMMMASKMHERRKMQVSDVVRWSGGRVTTEAVIRT